MERFGRSSLFWSDITFSVITDILKMHFKESGKYTLPNVDLMQSQCKINLKNELISFQITSLSLFFSSFLG